MSGQVTPSARNMPEIPMVAPETPALKADELPEGVVPIAFADLSLADADVDGLLDLVFSDELESESFEFPQNVQDLDGKEVAIVGYMIPMDWIEGGDRITSFMLVRDFAQCCFGGIPRPDEWLDAQAPLGESVQFFAYRPIRVIGTLHVGLDRVESSFVASVFQITVTDVTDSW